jgi:hypothetical protein
MDRNTSPSTRSAAPVVFVDPGLAGNDDDPAPFPLARPRQTEAAQSDATRDIELEETQPLLAVDLGGAAGSLVFSLSTGGPGCRIEVQNCRGRLTWKRTRP